MNSKKRRLARQAVAIALVAMMAATPLTPIGSVINTAITANAEAAPLTVGQTYTVGDEIPLTANSYVLRTAGAYSGQASPYSVSGTATIHSIEYRNNNYSFVVANGSGSDNAWVLEAPNGNIGEGTDVAVEFVSGAGTEEDPYVFKIVKNYVQSGDYWGLTADGKLEIFGEMPEIHGNNNTSASSVPWYNYRNDIKEVYALPGTKACKRLNHLFENCTNLVKADLSNLDTSESTDFSQMFYNCKSMTELELSDNFVTSKATSLFGMFYYCESLTSLDLNEWDTSNISSFWGVFYGCKSLTSLNVSNWNVSKMNNSNYLFSDCQNLTSLSLANWGASSNSSLEYNSYEMFAGMTNLETLDVGNFALNSTPGLLFKDDNKLKSITLTDAFSIGAANDGRNPEYYGALINKTDDKPDMRWFNEDGEAVSGDAMFAVISGQNGTIRRANNINVATVDDIPDCLYTGEAIEPTVTVKDGETTLVKGTDYKVTYEDNTEIGTATVAIEGLGDYASTKEVTFDIAATLTVPDDVTVNIYKNKTTLADKLDGKDAIKVGYYIVSDKQLTFDENKIDAKEYKPNVSNHPFKNKDNWDKYCYYVISLSDNVTATHSHTYKVQTANNKLNVKCDGEPGDYETIAELTIAEGNYEYGDKVDIEGKAYAVPEYDVADTDVTFGSIYIKNKADTSTSSTDMPTGLGSYSAEIGATFSKDSTRYSLYREFEIGKKDIAKLVKDSDSTVEKNDHIEISLKPVEGNAVSGKTVTYNGKQYTPVIKLVNYVYDYDQKKYVETVLTEDTDYTATLTPQTNAGHYTVTITAKEDSVNYKGTGTFDWDITKRNFENLSVTDNRTDDQKIYDGQAVENSEFTVEGLDTEANPGTASGSTFTYKYFKLNPTTIVEGDGIDALGADAFTEIESAPKDKGIYRVEITVKNSNYNDTAVAKNFEIKQRTITITPKEDNNITYGDKIGALAWTASNEVQGEAVQSTDVDLKVIKAEGENNKPIYVTGIDILNAGEYKYVLGHDDVPSNNNYKLVLAENAKLTVNKKALTKEMFTVSPTEYTYNGSEQTVNVTASDKTEVALPVLDPFELPVPQETELIKVSDWTIVSGNKATDAGEYKVTVKATENGNYSGELTLDDGDQKWTIKGKDINDEDPESPMTVEAPEKTYTGSDITETVTVKDGTKTLTKGTDYEIITEPDGDKYTDAQSLTQKNAGTYTFYIKCKGNYSGEKKVTWKINPAEIVSAKLTGGTKIYDGKAVTENDFRTTIKLLADDKAKDLTKTFVFKADDLSVDAPTNAGTYTVELTLSDPKGNYAAKTVTSTFEIKPREVEVYPAEGQTFEYGTTLSDIEDAINNPANIELEQAEEDSVTGIIAADNTTDTMTLMFGDKPFTIADAGDGKVNVGYYDIVTKEDMDVVGNYKLVYEYPVQVEVTKATLKDEWFTLYIRDEDTSESAAEETSNYTFNGKKIIVKANNGQQLVEGTDYTVNGTTEVYLPGEYSIDIKGKGNYTGKVTKTYKVEPNKDITAKTVVVDEAAETTTLPDTSKVVTEYTYDGESPEVSVVPEDGSAPLPETSKVAYKYWQKNEQNEWEAIEVAPVDAGDYKVQGEITAKGYEIDVEAAEFTITRKKINITIDPKDLKGVYGQESFTVPYTYADDAIIDKDKDTVAITGDIVVNAANSSAGEYELDYSGVTINSNNYELVFPDGLTFVISKKELDDSNIVFTNDTVALHDIGTSTATFKVVVDGKELVEGTDYDVAGTTEADEAGAYTVQIIGKGNYVGFAEKAWTLADDPAAREEAQAVIAENVNVTLGDDMSAKLSGGKKRITATVNATANDGYTITKTGFVYIPEADYVEGALVIGGDGVTNVGRNNAASYTYGMIDNAGTGIYVRGYAIVNNGAYETVVYTDAQKLVYDDLVRYTVTVEGGNITDTEDTTISYTGTDVKTNKPVVRVTAADAAEGQQFYCWEKNGVVASYAETFSFYMSEKDTTVTAVYVDADEEIEKQATAYIESVTPNKDTNKLTFVAVLNVPETFTMKKAGLVAADSQEKADNNNWDYVKTSNKVTDSMKNFRYTWNKSNVLEGDTWYVRPYVTYIDADQQEVTLYGDLVKATINGIV